MQVCLRARNEGRPGQSQTSAKQHEGSSNPKYLESSMQGGLRNHTPQVSSNALGVQNDSIQDTC
eukprot:scaffold129841_cov15-Tisochrysis_lutea.AAC.2